MHYLKPIGPRPQLIHERCDESKGDFPEGGQETLVVCSWFLGPALRLNSGARWPGVKR